MKKNKILSPQAKYWHRLPKHTRKIKDRLKYLRWAAETGMPIKQKPIDSDPEIQKLIPTNIIWRQS